ncbi:V-type proton ATPase catalytic subunit A-like isoform X1 [Silene latifolia]|uniref:V-type proton ATPase catalytic subunit A-like isoform X1 n=1 Tax=Silene latifolia TaxID=37657 RepID=UPI003D7869DE
MILTVIQRPLKTIALRSGDVCIPRGVVVPVLDKDILWEFQPNKLVEGDLSTGGDLYACFELYFCLGVSRRWKQVGRTFVLGSSNWKASRLTCSLT